MSTQTQTLPVGTVRRLDSRRWVITSLWLLFFLVSLGSVVYADKLFYSGNTQFLGPDESTDLFRQPIKKLYEDILATYAVYLTTMLASGFSIRRLSGADARSTPAFWIALSISLFWNSLVLFQMFQMDFGHSLDIETLSEWLNSWEKGTTWLITPFLVFYFGSER